MKAHTYIVAQVCFDPIPSIDAGLHLACEVRCDCCSLFVKC